MVGTVTTRVSVLPDVGSKLPADSDEVTVECTAVVEVLPGVLDEHNLIYDVVWPDVVPANQDVGLADVCGDDRFSPGVRSDNSINWRLDLGSHGMVNWECQSNSVDSALAGASDWKSVFRCIAIRSRLPEFPDGDGQRCFHDIGQNCIMDLSTGGTGPRVRTPHCSLETVAQTVLTRQRCRVPDVPSGKVTVAWLSCVPRARVVARRTVAI